MFRDDYGHCAWYERINALKDHGGISYLVFPWTLRSAYLEYKSRFHPQQYVPRDAPASHNWMKMGGRVKTKKAFSMSTRKKRSRKTAVTPSTSVTCPSRDSSCSSTTRWRVLTLSHWTKRPPSADRHAQLAESRSPFWALTAAAAPSRPGPSHQRACGSRTCRWPSRGRRHPVRPTAPGGDRPGARPARSYTEIST